MSSLTLRRSVGAIVLAATLAFTGSTALADVFSVDLASTTTDANDLLGAGPVLHVDGPALGLGPAVDLDAVSFGFDIVTGADTIFFSVDRASTGMSSSAVAISAAASEQAGDIYVTTNAAGVMGAPSGFNALDKDESGDAAPGFGLIADNVDNVDAYSHEEFDFTGDGVPDVPTYFSTDGSAEILVYMPMTGMTTVYFTPIEMGLDMADDIDALALMAIPGMGPRAYFSLAPGSPTLGALGASAADIFYTDFTSTSSIAYTAAELGLDFNDNVDALETNVAVPEPASLAMLAIGGLALAARRRRA